MAASAWPLLSYAFRPFFLLDALFSILAMLLWLGMLHAFPVRTPVGDPVFWHAHEMLFGFAGAAVAGFLLTAVATWTGRPPVSGGRLGMLVLAWVAGRLAMLGVTGLPVEVQAAVDLLFPALLAALVAREVVAGGSRRNYPVVGVVLMFGALDVAYHLAQTGVLPGAQRPALTLAVHLLLVLITIIGGRIVPAFTGNWLRQRGATALPRSHRVLEILIVPLAIVAAVADGVGAAAPIGGTFALVVAALHGVRLAGWRGRVTGAEPLVFILHVAYAWLPVGYLLLGLTALGLPLPRSAAIHALTMGAVGAMILAVATRVSLGHTGRALAAAPLTSLSYLLLNLAVLVRIASPLASGSYLALVDVAAAGWLAAFGLFLAVYWPILTGPRREASS